MRTPALFSALAAALVLLCCLRASAQSGQQGVKINDPELNNMPAVTVVIPAGWKLEGQMMTSPCTSLPWALFRAYSPDGLSEIRQLPTFGWKWSSNPRFVNFNGCMKYNGPISAAEFLKHFVETIPGGVHVVGDTPTSPGFSQWAQHFAEQLNGNAARMSYAPAKPTNTADSASIRIETHNGSFIIEQRIRVAVECTIYNNPGPLQGGGCFARTDIERAPKGKLNGLIQWVDNHDVHKPKADDQYAQAVIMREQQRGQAALAQMQRQQAAASRMLKSMNDQFMATMQHNHEAYMNQQESQFKSFQAGQAAQRQAQSNATSDWVDYALDRQTVTGQGGTVHIDSSYGHTWSSTSGGQTQWFQTNDSNANPNGVISGNWTQDTKVHGNGQPY